MAKKRTGRERGGATAGSPEGGAPAADREGFEESVHRTPTERERLMENPNLNQAGNDLGSVDQTQGSQTGNDIDPIPDLPGRHRR